MPRVTKKALRERWDEKSVAGAVACIESGDLTAAPFGREPEHNRWDFRGIPYPGRTPFPRGRSFADLDLSYMPQHGFGTTEWTACGFAGAVIATVGRCTFTHCDCSRLNLSGSWVNQNTFTNCDLGKASFRGGMLQDCVFTKCDMRDCNFQKLQYATNIQLDGCDLRGSKFGGSEFHDNVIGSWTITNCDLTDVEWNETNPALATIVNCKGYPPGKA